MNVAIYRILHLGAANWPPHAGDRAAQRASIRSGLLTVRRAKASEGGHVHIGEGGASVHYTFPGYGACSLAGYSLTHCHVALAAIVAGVRLKSTRARSGTSARLCGRPWWRWRARRTPSRGTG